MKAIKQIIFKCCILIINKTSIMVGGQAVIEGVMMRVPGAYATAIRTPEGKIVSKTQKFTSLAERYKLNNFIIIRGFVHLVDSMKIGFKTLEWSSTFIDENNTQEQSKLIELVMSTIAILIPISIFYLVPYTLTELIGFQDNQFLFSLISGVFKMTFFILYLLALSQIKDVKTLFQYHGAEHKVVYNFESGKKLTINNAQQFSTLHPRCGTSFVFILMITTILLHGIIDTSIIYSFNLSNGLTILQRVVLHLMFLPIIVGVGYEILKFLSKKQENIIFKLFSLPGLWLQKITTNQPSNDQIEVSIYALNSAFDNKINQYEGKKFIADAME